MHRPPAHPVRLVAVLSLLVAAALSAGAGWGAAPWWAVPLLAVAVAASEIAAVPPRFGRRRWSFSLTESALGAALVLATGAWTVLAVALGVAVAQSVRHQPRRKREFDVARFAMATALASTSAGLVGAGVAGACLGMAVFWLVNHLLVAVAVWSTSRRPLRSLVTSGAPLSALHTAGNSSIGLLAGYLAVTAPLGLLGLVVPLALLWSSYDQQTRRSAEARLYAELARGQERETGRSSDGSAQVVVTAAARLLGGADVELVLLASDGPVCYVGDETGTSHRRRVGSDVFDEPWVLRALGERGVHGGRDGARPFLCAVLGDPDAPLALLRARRGPDAVGFDRPELRLAQVLVGQAEAWLSVAELAARSRAATARGHAGETAGASSDVGPATAPALLVLHESAVRLARLAGSAGGVDDIVEELHLVERAVASLLGAIALADGSDLLCGPQDPAPVRPAADWTTTGVLS
ncbi:MAG: hypothetical protein WD794_07795 [Mycobacteriales bacterium]